VAVQRPFSSVIEHAGFEDQRSGRSGKIVICLIRLNTRKTVPIRVEQQVLKKEEERDTPRLHCQGSGMIEEFTPALLIQIGAYACNERKLEERGEKGVIKPSPPTTSTPPLRDGTKRLIQLKNLKHLNSLQGWAYGGKASRKAGSSRASQALGRARTISQMKNGGDIPPKTALS